MKPAPYKYLSQLGQGDDAAAARALLTHTDMNAAQIVRAGLEIAADLCIYTNRSLVVEEI